MHENDDVKKYVLLVEDDTELAELVKEYLEQSEIHVEIEPHGLNAADRILNESPDLVILDLNLPGKDGISICREVRPFYQGSILMLTASNESVDQILGLEIGADDYVQKPVEPRILLARIRALMRRNETKVEPDTPKSLKEEVINFGVVSINKSARVVQLNSADLNLSNPEYEMLVLLAENPGKVLSRDDIFQLLRGIEYDGQNRFIDITISQLRAKLGGDGNSDKHIKTVRNKGYLFVPEI